MPDQTETAARCHGVRVPPSPYLTETRIARINAARYEGAEIAGALSVVRPGDRVLELGAGLGVVGAVIAKNAKPEAVLSFEANPELVPHIRALYRANGLERLIELRNSVLVAGPDRPETVTFHLARSFLGSSLLDRPGRNTRPVAVPTEDFDAVLRSFRPTVLVMDIEGGERDLLERASLEGLRAVVIEFHPDLYGKEGMQACKAALRKAGFRKRAGPSTRRVWTCTRPEPGPDTGPDPARPPVAGPPRDRPEPAPPAADATPPDPAGGWSHELRNIAGAIVQAPREAQKVSPSGVTDRFGTDLPEAALWHNERRTNLPFPAPDPVDEEIAGTWLWGGTLWSYFAHFIVESPGRLWALDRPIPRPDGLLYIPRRDTQPPKLQPFQAAFFAALGIELPVRVVTGSARVERLVVPGQGFGLGAISAGTPAFRAFIHERFGRDVAPEGGEKLYISRSRLGSKRGKLLGEDRIEHELAARGYEIFHPQAHDLDTQIARYKAARKVVAPEGSALHLFAFVGRADQQVALIRRRRSRATAHIIRHLESFTGRAPTVVNALAEVWQPAWTRRKRHAIGEPDMARLQAALQAAGFIDDAKPWPPLTPQDTRKARRRGYEATGESLLD